MATQALTITASSAILREILTELTGKGYQVSQPVPARSIADALDAPIGADEVRTMLELMTIASTATVAIVSAIVKAVQKFEHETVAISDARTGQKLADIDCKADEGAARLKLEASLGIKL